MGEVISRFQKLLTSTAVCERLGKVLTAVVLALIVSAYAMHYVDVYSNSLHAPIVLSKAEERKVFRTAEAIRAVLEKGAHKENSTYSPLVDVARFDKCIMGGVRGLSIRWIHNSSGHEKKERLYINIPLSKVIEIAHKREIALGKIRKVLIEAHLEARKKLGTDMYKALLKSMGDDPFYLRTEPEEVWTAAVVEGVSFVPIKKAEVQQCLIYGEKGRYQVGSKNADKI